MDGIEENLLDSMTYDETTGPETGGYRTAEDPVSESRKAHVTKLNAAFDQAKGFWSSKFDQMRRDQKFAAGKQWEQIDRNLSSEFNYTVNIVQRHIQQRVSALYAKNPRFVATPKQKIDYTVWDGKPDTISKIQEQLTLLAQQGGGPDDVDPAQMAILQDYNRVMIQREYLTRVGRTMQFLFEHYLDEQVVPFKKQMKRLVRRGITNGVGYVKLGFQRVMQMRPEIQRNLADAMSEMATLERLARDHAAGDFDETSSEFDRLTTLVQKLQMDPGIPAREGLVLEYPFSTSVIPDTKCRSLDGFQGCDWVAEEFYLSALDIKEIYDVDVGSGYRSYVCVDKATQRFTPSPIDIGGGDDKAVQYASVRVMQHKRDGLVYVMCDGFPDFLAEPAPPEVQLERFWTIFTLMFNELEDEEDVFPPSDVLLLRHPQYEYNRARQGLREHRQAGRPKTFVAGDRLSEEDQDKLRVHPANAVIELEAMQPGERIEDLLQVYRGPPIDAALYDTGPFFDDTMRVVGTQEANLGGTSNATATESSIAESSRLSSLDSNVDDLDELLTELARASGQVLLLNVSQVTVRRLVGAGATWPSLSRLDIAEELMLTVAAGSSGRPNQAQEIQNFERLAPLLMQIPGIKPEWLATQGIMRLDDKLDLAEAISPAQPSIAALNGANPMTGMGGDPSTDPAAQGAEGAQNAPGIVGTEGDSPGRPGRPPMDPNIDAANSSGMTVN